MKQEISNECKEFLKKLKRYQYDITIPDLNKNDYYISYHNMVLLFNRDGMVYLLSDENGKLNRDGLNGIVYEYSIVKTDIQKGWFSDSTTKAHYLPFTKFEMDYIFNEVKKFMNLQYKKEQDDRKNLLMKLNLTEDELQQLKTILK